MNITVCTPTHLARMRNGMLARAMHSISYQTKPAAAISVAIDVVGRGAPVTRQRALDAVQTPWVAFLDSDDYFLPDHLAALSKHAEESGADFVYSWFKIEDQFGRILEEDPIFPPGHYLNQFNPEDPIETTITVLVRTELAKEVGFQALNRGHGQNTGEDAFFTLGCLAAGAKISHLVRKTWIWSHHGGNTSGFSTKGDAATVS